MTYAGYDLNIVQSSMRSEAPARIDPRAAMADRLPGFLQPLLTWLTARPAPGERYVERNPHFYVWTATATVAAGMILAWASLDMPALAGRPGFILGSLLTCSGLGLFQVVVFHHCSHGTVFRSRDHNITLGRLISVLLLFKFFDDYKKEHMLHHSANKLLTDEDEFTNFIFGMCGLEPGIDRKLLWRRVIWTLVSPAFHARFLLRRLQASIGAADRYHQAIGIAALLVPVLIAAACGRLGPFVLVWLLPLSVLLQIATVFRILCEHRFPDPVVIANRGKEFVCHATAGVFPGSPPPAVTAGSARGLLLWTLWWADMLLVQMFVRVFVLVGDAPAHDFHHRRPATKRWTDYIHARQKDVDAGCPGFPANYGETWGLFRAIDENLTSLARTRPETLARA